MQVGACSFLRPLAGHREILRGERSRPGRAIFDGKPRCRSRLHVILHFSASAKEEEKVKREAEE